MRKTQHGHGSSKLKSWVERRSRLGLFEKHYKSGNVPPSGTLLFGRMKFQIRILYSRRPLSNLTLKGDCDAAVIKPKEVGREKIKFVFH